MHTLLFANATLVLPEGIVTGWLATKGRTIEAIGLTDPPLRHAETVYDATGTLILPGFIDLHVHGAIGVDAMDADPEGLQRVSRFHAAHGVTAWLPTTWTGSEKGTLRALEAIAEVTGPVSGGATILGAHMEGPYLNPVRRGAQDITLIRPADRREACRFLETGVVRLLALAPEIEDNRWLIEECRERGITTSAGHTDATYEQAVQAVRAGVRHVTHTFNGMRSFGHREPGLLGAALTMPELRCELIADNVHVNAVVIKVLADAKGTEGVVLITDAVRATGLSDGGYDLGDRPAVRANGAVRLSDGTLAGSVLTLDEGLRNYRDATGLPLSSIWPVTSRNAALALGIEATKGSIEAGKDADLALLDPHLRVLATVAEGVVVHGAERLELAAARDGHRAAAGEQLGGRLPSV